MEDTEHCLLNCSKHYILSTEVYATINTQLNIDFDALDIHIKLRVCFGDPLTRTRSSQPCQRVAKTAWSSIYSYVTSEHFRPVNQILTSNKKVTINLLKLLLGFKSILFLMPGTQHTQACVLIKITIQN